MPRTTSGQADALHDLQDSRLCRFLLYFRIGVATCDAVAAGLDQTHTGDNAPRRLGLRSSGESPEPAHAVVLDRGATVIGFRLLPCGPGGCVRVQ